MNFDGYTISYQNDAMHSYMLFKLSRQEQLIDYQIKIIKENPIPYLLALHKRQLDQELYLCYEITSKINLAQYLARKKLHRHEFLTILKGLIKALQIGKNYLLQGGKYVLDSKLIYINPSTLEVAVAYLPVQTATDVREEIRQFLIDLVIYKVSFISADEGSFMYRLLTLLKNEAFGLEQLEKLVSEIAVGDAEMNQPEDMGKAFTEQPKRQEKKTIATEHKTPYVFILVQLLTAVLAALSFRLVMKQNQSVDLYSVGGIVLLALSADFLALKKLGVLDKKKMMQEGSKEKQAVHREKNWRKRQKRENDRQKEKQCFQHEQQGSGWFENMETSVLMPNETGNAYLTGCRGNQHEMIVIDKSSFIIGRLKHQVDYVASNHAIGKLHAEFIQKEGSYYIRDLNSRNGTYINGERITSNVLHAVKNNDRVTFADSEYQFTWQQGASQQ